MGFLWSLYIRSSLHTTGIPLLGDNYYLVWFKHVGTQHIKNSQDVREKQQVLVVGEFLGSQMNSTSQKTTDHGYMSAINMNHCQYTNQSGQCTRKAQASQLFLLKIIMHASFRRASCGRVRIRNIISYLPVFLAIRSKIPQGTQYNKPYYPTSFTTGNPPQKDECKIFSQQLGCLCPKVELLP